MGTPENGKIRHQVRKTYGKVAQSSDARCGCSPADGCCTPSAVPAEEIAVELGYAVADLTEVPKGSNMGLGCGNPQLVASLRPGETVLDLGSGGGFDCFLAAKAVGAEGRVIGVDMTPEMIGKARINAEHAGYPQVEFRLGEIERLPVADNAVDVIISNCVINLSPDKRQVFNDAFRVLKPGGRLAISDIVATAELPVSVKSDMALFTGCMAGAASVDELETILTTIGFTQIRITPNQASKAFIRDWAPGRQIEEYLVSATVEAIKPAP